MFKIIAISGSARKKHTYQAVEQFLTFVSEQEDVEYEIIRLSDLDIRTCTGCIQCLDKGEEYCPLKDERDIVIQKMMEADGVILATPNYSFHVSGMMKVFLDRLGFVFHRPRFFGKAFTAIVTQGVYGGGSIIKYFQFISKALGFNPVKGAIVTTRVPIAEKTRIRNERNLRKLAVRFARTLRKKALPLPSVFELMLFRMSRSTIKNELNPEFRDYSYFQEQGWFESQYYYPVRLGPLKRLLGRMFDGLSVK